MKELNIPPKKQPANQPHHPSTDKAAKDVSAKQLVNQPTYPPADNKINDVQAR